jgi:uncharacterized RDD family membrane protein YckC
MGKRLVARIIDSLVLGVALVPLYIAFLVQLAYEGSMIALRGATVGKQVMKIRVQREDGQLPGWGPSLVRWLIPFGGLFVCCVGQLVVYVSPFFDGSKRYQGGTTRWPRPSSSWPPDRMS